MSEDQLTSREINDIFWGKKRRYMLSASAKYTTEDGYFGPDMAEEVKSIYRKNQGKEPPKLTGTEFIDAPPLSSGLNGMAKAIARMMLVSDGMKDRDDEESNLLREIIASFFSACGVDEEGKVYKDKEKRRKAEEEFYAKRERFINLTQTPVDEKKSEPDDSVFAAFSNRKVEKGEIGQYGDLISDTYRVQIDAGKFYVGVLANAGSDEALYISYAFAGWIEIVWFHFFDDDMDEDHKSDLLRYLIRVEKERRGEQKGIFWEVHLDEIKDIERLRRVLKKTGFENRQTFNNVYDLTLGQVAEGAFLEKAAKSMSCVSLTEAQGRVLDTIDYMIQDDARPVPVGMYPIWDDYLQDESLICLKDGKPVGALLFSE